LPAASLPPKEPSKLSSSRTGKKRGRPRKDERSPIDWTNYQLDWIFEDSRLALAVKGAQEGYSYATMMWAILRCAGIPNHLVTLLSASEAQATELLRKAAEIIRLYAKNESDPNHEFFARADVMVGTITFPNASRLIARSSKPETARSYTGDIVLDEFAHHLNSDQLFSAAYRQISLGQYQMRIVSTPAGKHGKFYDLAKELKLVEGEPLWSATGGKPPVINGWRGHWCDIHKAVADGFPLDIDEIQRGCDDFTFRQEYLCEFLSGDLLWIPPELIDKAVSDLCPMGPPSGPGPYYAGWDIARHRDLSVIWFWEKVGDVLSTAGVMDLSNIPTYEQTAQARAWMPMIQRMSIDQTGMGIPMAEELHRDFPDKVTPFSFTTQSKEAIAVLMRDKMERGLVRIPNDRVVRRSFGSIRRGTTSTGQARFDAERDAVSQHGDHWWAACLGASASEELGPQIVEYYKKEYARRETASRPETKTRTFSSPEETKEETVKKNVEFSREEFNRVLRRR
jgi:phage FluMu gp28-like protein